MDTHNGKTSFCKWTEPVSYENLPPRLQGEIEPIDAYVKKLFLIVSSS